MTCCTENDADKSYCQTLSTNKCTQPVYRAGISIYQSCPNINQGNVCGLSDGISDLKATLSEATISTSNIKRIQNDLTENGATVNRQFGACFYEISMEKNKFKEGAKIKVEVTSASNLNVYLSVGSGISDVAKVPLFKFPSYPQQLTTTDLPYSYDQSIDPTVNKFIIEVTPVLDQVATDLKFTYRVEGEENNWFMQLWLNELAGDENRTKLILYSSCAGVIVICFLCSVGVCLRSCCCGDDSADVDKVQPLDKGYGRTSMAEEPDVASNGESNHDLYSDNGKSPMVGPGVKKNAVMPFALDSIDSANFDNKVSPHVVKMNKNDSDQAKQRQLQ